MNALYEENDRLWGEVENWINVAASHACYLGQANKQIEKLEAEANLNMQEICRLRIDKEEERNISDILDGINQQEICRLRGQVALLRSKIIKKAGKE